MDHCLEAVAEAKSLGKNFCVKTFQGAGDVRTKTHWNIEKQLFEASLTNHSYIYIYIYIHINHIIYDIVIYIYIISIFVHDFPVFAIKSLKLLWEEAA